MSELKPCPFCGGRFEIDIDEEGGGIAVYHFPIGKCIVPTFLEDVGDLLEVGESITDLENIINVRPTEYIFESRIKELDAENAALKEALDISHKNHDRCNRDYVLLKKHLDGINRAVDVLCPKVARAITKLTPPSIADAYRADHQFARELRAALNDVTDAQNTVYKPEAE